MAKLGFVLAFCLIGIISNMIYAAEEEDVSNLRLHVQKAAWEIKSMVREHPELKEKYDEWKEDVSSFSPEEAKEQAIAILTEIGEKVKSKNFKETVKQFIELVKTTSADVIHKVLNSVIAVENAESNKN